jgi:hypothetical protein
VANRGRSADELNAHLRTELLWFRAQTLEDQQAIDARRLVDTEDMHSLLRHFQLFGFCSDEHPRYRRTVTALSSVA